VLRANERMLQGIMKEIEIKLAFDSPSAAREQLVRVGAIESVGRAFEDNACFDREDHPLHRAKRLLRLRRVGDRSWLTYKAPIPGEHRHKVRIEHETSVADPDAMDSILEGVGFSPSYRYQKYRTEFTVDDLHVCLDETPLGCFVELEGEPASIDRIAGRLGFSPENYIRDSYQDLHESAIKERGGDPTRLVFVAGEAED
jgi:adenylate cyclase class 2